MASNVSVEINLSIRAVYDPMAFQNSILVRAILYIFLTNKQSAVDRQRSISKKKKKRLQIRADKSGGKPRGHVPCAERMKMSRVNSTQGRCSQGFHECVSDTPCT